MNIKEFLNNNKGIEKLHTINQLLTEINNDKSILIFPGSYISLIAEYYPDATKIAIAKHDQNEVLINKCKTLGIPAIDVLSKKYENCIHLAYIETEKIGKLDLSNVFVEYIQRENSIIFHCFASKIYLYLDIFIYIRL